MKIRIAHGRVIDPASRLDRQQDLCIVDDKIISIGKTPEGFAPDHTIDAEGLVVCPGLVDLAARLREPGYEYRATLSSEVRAAVAGGITSVAIPPDTDPVLDEPGLVQMLRQRAHNLKSVNIYPVGALTVGLAGERLAEMQELTDAGCIAFSQAEKPITDTNVLLQAMQYASTFDYCLWLQPIAPFLARDGVAHDGQVAARLGLAGIPSQAETIALFSYIELASIAGTRLHISRISSGRSLELIASARASGLNITCDVSINHLHLTENDIGYFNAHCRLTPPLRTERDRDIIRASLRSGSINALCSNHAPLDDDDKQLPFADATPGASGLELLLPLTLKWAIDENIPLADALARITSDPAKVIGTSNCGGLSIDSPADICIFQPDIYRKVVGENLRSQGKNTPFLGYELPGQVYYTLIGGQVVFDHQQH